MRLLIAGLLILSVMACTQEATVTTSTNVDYFEDTTHPYIFTDPERGCQYLVFYDGPVRRMERVNGVERQVGCQDTY